MGTTIRLCAALLSLGLVGTAWASTSPLPVSPVQENDGLPMNEPRQKPVAPPASLRGQMLYENHCMACHASVVHIRGAQRTRSLTELRERVSHWASDLHLRWGTDEIDEVATYLNNQYYRFESR